MNYEYSKFTLEHMDLENMEADQVLSNVRTTVAWLLPVAFGAYGFQQSLVFFRILPPSKLPPAETFNEGVEFGLLYGWAMCSIFISTVGMGVVLSLFVADVDVDEIIRTVEDNPNGNHNN